jgi:wyosine [tRNA(Phe)-imidazoG37] synthetase (radical SAM superfamily)
MTLVNQSGHSLVDSIFYGPVISRRFGKTMGVNFLPYNNKICGFNCLYCQLGWNESHIKHLRFPNPLEFENAWASNQQLFDQFPVNYFVVSGNGEPSLNPSFYELSMRLISKSKNLSTTPKTICFTSGTKIFDKKIFESLSFFH